MKKFRSLFAFKNKSLRFQLFIQLLSIVLVLILLLLIINSTFMQNIFFYSAERNLSKTSDQVNKVDMTAETYYDELKNVEKSNGTMYIEVFDGTSNTLIYSTVMNDFRKHTTIKINENVQLFFGMAKEKKLDNIENIRTDEKGSFYVGKERATDTVYLAYSSILDSGNIVRIYTQENIIEANASYASGILRITIAVLAVLLMIAFYVYSRRFSRPLIEMNDVTKHMVNMDFSKKCSTKTDNEIGELAQNINSLSTSLDGALTTLKEKNSQLEKDIEHERKMEQSRKEFISNVSHELKTPISIIQGYAEGLKLGISDSPEETNEYCEVIIEEAARMNNLVYDLLELSYYESGSYKLKQEKFSINDLVNDYLSSEKIILSDNKITVQNDIDENMTGYGDESKISMVLNNYFSNAVSHCDAERIIRIYSESVDDCYRINVFNTGENISEDSIDEMWKSFYRGDKSHHRDEGRFGIGLSIVSAIQNLHSMKYGCKNVENGVIFWFDIKKV